MLLIAWWLITTYGVILGSGITGLAYLASWVILDDRLSAREGRHLDALPGGWDGRIAVIANIEPSKEYFRA